MNYKRIYDEIIENAKPRGRKCFVIGLQAQEGTTMETF